MEEGRGSGRREEGMGREGVREEGGGNRNGRRGGRNGGTVGFNICVFEIRGEFENINEGVGLPYTFRSKVISIDNYVR